MQIDQVKKLQPIDRLVYWIKERESIRLKKEAGEPKPWTDDVIIQSYRFCNVRRMDDKVSKWLTDNWYTPFKDHKNSVTAAGFARIFNLPSTLELVTKYIYCNKISWNTILRVLRSKKLSGANVFNAAYIVSTCGNKADKIEWVINKYLMNLRDVQVVTSSMKITCENVRKCYGFSSFMSGQVVSDLRWSLTGSWEDRNTWAPIGPGSKRGLNRVTNEHPTYSRPEQVFEELLITVSNKVKAHIPVSISSRIECIDYQNCMCEFDKYERVLWGQGKPKQKYTGVV